MTRTYDCEICQGRGTIRLPLYKQVTLTARPASKIDCVSSREYACPECGDLVRQVKLAVIREDTYAVCAIDDPKYIERVKGGLAHQIAMFMLEHGYITFERGPTDSCGRRFGMRATAGVVSPNHVARLEERIAERQTELAETVTAQAVRDIERWGSEWSWISVSKDDATRFVRGALQKVLRDRAAWKQLNTFSTEAS